MQQTLKVEESIVDRMAGLVSQGAIAEVQFLQQQNRLQELQSQVAQTEATLREVQAESIKSKQQIQRELADLERQLVETNKSQEYESLRAPVKGYVFDLIVASPGYAASSGETLLKIVPEGTLEASVFVTNADGFLRPKMPAQVALMPTPSPNTAISQASSSALASSRLSPINKTQNPVSPPMVEASIPRKAANASRSPLVRACR